ncbi:putative ribokinase [Thecaphora frezii]
MATPNRAAPLCLVRSSINVDETFSVPHIVAPGETLSSTSLSSRPGGKGANVSAAISLAGASVGFVGGIGTDAPWPLDELSSRGVDVSLVHHSSSHPTGRAFIQIAADGENSIVLLKGANFAPSPSDDPAQVFGAEDRTVTHLVVHNEIPLDVTTKFLVYARDVYDRARVTTIFNPSPMPTVEELQAFPWWTTDVLVVNEGEGAQLLRALDPQSLESLHDTAEGSEERSKQVVDLLAKLESLRSTAWIVLTRGAKGVMARIRIANPQQPADERAFFNLPPFKPQQVVDTTGAGDTFAGNLVAALMGANLDPQQEDQQATKPDSAAAVSKQHAVDVLTWASKAAAAACETQGAMRSIPKAEDVKARFP